MKGTLYVCGTPIGNLEDISLRVLRTLKEVDVIAAEDTRHTLKLLNHFEIKASLTSYHEYNKAEKGKNLVNQLLMGRNIALVSDAGMPGISDPGEELIGLCHANGIPVTSAPGPTAVITALVLSGISARRYVFEGFLPKEKKDKRKILESLKLETRTIVFYESPHQLLKTLVLMQEILGERRISVIRELTKQHEEVRTDQIETVIAHFTAQTPLGEFVIVVEGLDEKIVAQVAVDKWNELSIPAHMDVYIQQGMDKKEAMKCVAKDRGVAKREIYNALLELDS